MNSSNKSKKNSLISNSRKSKKITKDFGTEITKKFMEILMMIKMYHWNTNSYAVHQATDELYKNINTHMDKFMEIYMGKVNKNIVMKSVETINIINIVSKIKLKSEIVKFKSYLVNLTDNPFMKLMTNTDLFNIRDELLADLNQFLYLLKFN